MLFNAEDPQMWTNCEPVVWNFLLGAVIMFKTLGTTVHNITDPGFMHPSSTLLLSSP